jgi:hypothetical protein
MGELLAMIIIPPLVGLVTYAVLHLLWKTRRGSRWDRTAAPTRCEIAGGYTERKTRHGVPLASGDKRVKKMTSKFINMSA